MGIGIEALHKKLCNFSFGLNHSTVTPALNEAYIIFNKFYQKWLNVQNIYKVT
jgi:hypothetical protein